MGKIVVSQNVTLDGVVEDPSGEGGFRHGGWFEQFMGQDWEAWAELELAEAQGAEALLRATTSVRLPVLQRLPDDSYVDHALRGVTNVVRGKVRGGVGFAADDAQGSDER